MTEIFIKKNILTDTVIAPSFLSNKKRELTVTHNSTDIIVVPSPAPVIGGAKAVRIEGVRNVAAVREAMTVAVIGITRVAQPDSDVSIKPAPGAVRLFCRADADIVVFDAMKRQWSFKLADLAAQSVGPERSRWPTSARLRRVPILD